MGKAVKWTAIVLTCPQASWSAILQRELELRQAKGQIDKDVFLLTVEDPKIDVGSGGATINALLTVAEYISAQRGYAVLNVDVLQDSHILILHNGRPYSYDSCGRPFTTLPAKYTDPGRNGLVCVIDALLALITEQLAVHAGPGVWVSSTDMILTLPRGARVPWESCDACAITVPALPGYCRNHGVYKLDSKGFVEDIMFRETIKKMEPCERPDGTVPLVCGLVYFSVAVSEKLLTFFTKPPLDACTYFGVDSGEPPIKLSLFFDVMLPMCPQVDARDFRSGARSGNYGKQSLSIGDIKTMRMARTILWNDLKQYRIKACMLENGNCVYPHSIKEHKAILMDEPIRDCFTEGVLKWSNIVHSHIQSEDIEESSIIINSIVDKNVKVGAKTLISHSCLYGNMQIGKDSFIGGLNTQTLGTSGDLEFADSTIVQGHCVYLPMIDKSLQIITTHGRFDTVDMPMWKSTATVCNSPWLVFMNRTGIVKEDLWGQDMDNDLQTIFTARMFPAFHARDKVGLTEILWLQGVIEDDDDRQILNRWRSSYRLSLENIQQLIELEQELESRRKLFYSVGQCDMTEALKHSQNLGFRSLYQCAVMEEYTDTLLQTLDSVCEESMSQLQAGVAARTLANIADILGCMAGPKGGLRSGPAANVTWSKAFKLLEAGEIKAGVAALAEERANWLGRPDKLIRAARHYEGAAQILIRHAVMTAKEFFRPGDEFMTPIGHWALAECPARIDLSGGWSDTPPITYEHGGAVCIMGLLIRGQRPIGAKTRRISEPKIVLVIHSGSESKDVVCTELSDLRDYYQPHSTGALLKAAFVCADIIELESSMSLADQLTLRYGGGFEVHSWSNLPHGSGMGASSILAGAVMTSILKAAGKTCNNSGIVHSVLYLEQLLTTGGGWQDQVGGLFGGITLGMSDAQLPLYVEVKNVMVKPETIQAFNDRLVLIYTGKTRLARNLLQDVVRNWYARNPQIVETEDGLVKLAKDCVRFFESGDLEAVGMCMDSYWMMKKMMAPSCEPEIVTRIMTSVRPHALGMCMAGAGGGGFMYVLAKDTTARENIVQILADLKDLEGVEIYEASIDQDGMHVSVIEEEEKEDEVDEDEEEDMTDYYNQPETLLDEPKATKEGEEKTGTAVSDEPNIESKPLSGETEKMVGEMGTELKTETEIKPEVTADGPAIQTDACEKVVDTQVVEKEKTEEGSGDKVTETVDEKCKVDMKSGGEGDGEKVTEARGVDEGGEKKKEAEDVKEVEGESQPETAVGGSAVQTATGEGTAAASGEAIVETVADTETSDAGDAATQAADAAAASDCVKDDNQDLCE